MSTFDNQPQDPEQPEQEQPQDDGHVVAQTTGTPADEPASGAPDVSGLTLQAHRLEEHGYWSFGVTLNGQYVQLSAVKLGLVDAPSSQG